MRLMPLVAELLQHLKPFTIAKLLLAAVVKLLLAAKHTAITAGSNCCSFAIEPAVVEQLKHSAAATVRVTIAAAISFSGPSFSTLVYF